MTVEPPSRDDSPSQPPSDTASWTPVGWDTQVPGGAIEPVNAPTLTTALVRLRQERLRAAALGLSAWWGLILVQMGLIGFDWAWPAAVVLILLGMAVFLSRRGTLRPITLRAMEWGMFGLAAGVFAIFEHDFLLETLRQHDVAAFHVTLKNGLINTLTLMLAYAVLIPNPWQRAAPVVIGLVVLPLLTLGMLSRTHPEVERFVVEEGAFQMPGLNPTMLAVGAGLALYGIHVLNTLRVEAFEARRLNQYRLGLLVGFGGMGEVYQAEHRLLKRTCAIKLIHPKTEHDPQAIASFEREVQVTARLSHPNIVEIYDYGETDDGTFFYVMEYLEGLSFGELVRLHGPMEPGRVIYLLTQVCEGLAEAHAAGLIHRDLKPANLFAARFGRRYDVAKILDFGLVMDTTVPPADRQREEGAVGTLPFMAPEQQAGLSVLDRRADIFAMGAVAYYLLTGRLAFTDDGGFRERDATRVSRRPVPPSQIRPGIPADLERVVLRCLEEAPAARFANSETLRTALAACESAADWNADCARRWWKGKEG